MRLTSHQVQAIKLTAQTVLGADARVTLFGSRVDDTRRGGDIDLMFETPLVLPDRAAREAALYVSLIRQLGDRKIDVVLKDAQTMEAPVMRMAKQTGVLL